MKLTTIIFRLFLSLILGGLIGIEREDKNRPAGFRTHILVCVGSAVVMLTSQYIFDAYRGQSNMDPARLGAQVISGIGFLGAGTIIRQGSTVKGLTTAASLWAVACIGLAIGIGFYEGAIVGATMIYFTLMVLSRFGRVLQNKSSYFNVLLTMQNKPEKVGEISLLFGRQNINIRDIEFLNSNKDDSNDIAVKLDLKLPHGLSHKEVIRRLTEIEGINTVEEV